MNTLFKLVVVPIWLDELIQANNLEPDAYIRLEVLKKYFTDFDIVRYIALNEDQKLKDLVFGEFGDIEAFNLTTHIDAELERKRWMAPSSFFDSKDPECTEVLMSMRDLAKRVAFDSTSYVFELFRVSLDVYGVRLKKRDPEISHEADLYGCYDKSIELLSRSYSFEAIASLELFKRFVTFAQIVP